MEKSSAVRRFRRGPRAGAALALLLGVAGCRGLGETGEGDWASEPRPVAWDPADGLPPFLPSTREQEPRTSSGVGALLSSASGADHSRRRVRVAPAPILGAHDIGFGFTVRW